LQNKKSLEAAVCRNIKPLFNFDPPASAEDIQAAALQYVRKVSGYTRPSRANQATFDAAVIAIAAATQTLLDQLETQSAPRSRAEQIARAKEHSALRFSKADGLPE
jgi:hypothetical protein